MTFVYDLVLNFNSELYDFYEWKKDDAIYHIKRINLIKTTKETYNDILFNKVIIDNEFLFSIFNKCEYFENRSVKTIDYAFLITDNYRVMAIMLDINGRVIKYSSLLLDEEEDVLDISDRLAVLKINYEKKEKKDEYNNLTRLENHIIRYIKKDLVNSYKENNLSKLKYLYYEYFSKPCDDINEIYQSLLGELNNLNEKHYNLYNLIKLSYTGKSV